jgi:cytochrome c biogenesis protein CcdA
MNLTMQGEGQDVGFLITIGIVYGLCGWVSALILGRKGRTRGAGWALGLLGPWGILIAAVLPRVPAPGTEPRAAPQGAIRRPAMVTAAAVTLLVIGGFLASGPVLLTVALLVEDWQSDEIEFAFVMALFALGLGLPYVIAGIRVRRLSNTWRVWAIVLLVFFAWVLIGISFGVANDWQRGEASGVVALSYGVFAGAFLLWCGWLIIVLVKHRRLFRDPPRQELLRP